MRDDSLRDRLYGLLSLKNISFVTLNLHLLLLFLYDIRTIKHKHYPRKQHFIVGTTISGLTMKTLPQCAGIDGSQFFLNK